MGRSRYCIAALPIIVGLSLLPSAALGQARNTAPLAPPFFFEPNVGQARGPASFVARARDYTIGVSPDEARFEMAGASVRMRFANAAIGRQVVGVDRLPGVSSYFRGRDPAQWRTGIPQFSRLRGSDIYPGVDVLYYGRDGALEYDLIVAPGADPSVVALTFEGADSVGLAPDGDIVVRAAGGELRQRRPLIYQDTPEGRREIAGRYTIDEFQRVRFRVGDYDRSRSLVIDPVVLYASYFGGPGLESVSGLAVDGMGSVYIAGTVSPTPTCCPGSDVFVAKFDPTGSRLLYAVTFGGNDADIATGIAVDGFGAVYVGGYTFSTDFPVHAAVQPGLHPGLIPMDGFFAKLNATGTALVYSSYLGGAYDDEVRALTVTRSGQLIVAGATSSPDFPIVNAIQPELSGSNDAFVTIVSSTGAALERSTFFGGLSTEWVDRVAWDEHGGLVITGGTFSGASFPLLNPFQATADDSVAIFVARFTADDYDLVYSTLLAGNNDDYSLGVAIGSSGAAVVSGYTRSSNFPVIAPLQAMKRGESDAFVAKFEASGTAVFVTLLGGESADFGRGVAMNASGEVFVSGQTESADFPIVDPLRPNGSELNGFTGFITQLDAQGTSIAFSTYVGGAFFNGFSHLALDRAGALYASGWAQNPDFPVTPFAAQRTFGGLVDVGFAKLGAACAIDVTANVAAGALLSLPIPFTPWRIELLVVRNESNDPIGSPISVVLSGLQDAVLVGALGTTDCTGAPGSPIIVVPPGPEGFLEPGQITGAWLLFYQTGTIRPTYRSVVLSGVPGR